MTSTVPTTDLEAVNLLLWTIGESPVDSVSQTEFDLGVAAYSKLNEVCREVQTRGWSFNTEHEFPLSLSPADGTITLPANTMRVKVAVSAQDRVAASHRGNRLYDPIAHTFDYRVALGSTATSLKVDIIFLLDWADLPEAARWYIAVMAARRFCDGALASQDIHQFTARDEEMALAMLQEAEGDTGEFNILTDNWSVLRVLDRGAYSASFGNR